MVLHMNERCELYTGLDTLFRHLFSLAESDQLSFVADVELSFTQIRTLHLLATADEPLPIHEVARQLGLSLTSAGRNIDHLVRLGSVIRRENPSDRRIKLVSITPQGLRVIDQHFEPRRRALRAFVERLPEENVRAFLDALRPLMAIDYFTADLSTAQPQLPPADPEETTYVPYGG